jgi:hypothetical protein
VAGFANTPLAIYHGVDFRVATHVQVPDEPYTTFLQEGRMTHEELEVAVRSATT